MTEAGPTDPVGTAKEIEEFFRTQRQTLEKRIAQMVGNREIARDIVQDTLLDFYARSTTEVRAPIGFLTHAAVNRAIDHLRHRKVVASHEARVEPPEAAPPADEEVFRAEGSRRLHQVINTLTEVERTALLMRSKGHSHEQIAERLGKTKGMVGYTIHKALNRCRRLTRELDVQADDVGPNGLD